MQAGVIRHMVFLKFQESVSGEDKHALFNDLEALKAVAPGILDFQVRANISPETAVVHGFNDLFWFDFIDEASRDAYLEHPDHKVVGARLVAACDGGLNGLLVADFRLS